MIEWCTERLFRQDIAIENSKASLDDSRKGLKSSFGDGDFIVSTKMMNVGVSYAKRKEIYVHVHRHR